MTSIVVAPISDYRSRASINTGLRLLGKARCSWISGLPLRGIPE
jgi:hypothetical protein